MNLKTVPQKKRTIVEAIEAKMPGVAFKPKKELYETLGINKKRFGLIMKGRLRPYADEIVSICNYFKLDINELL